jgi:hypothetical protein
MGMNAVPMKAEALLSQGDRCDLRSHLLLDRPPISATRKAALLATRIPGLAHVRPPPTRGMTAGGHSVVHLHDLTCARFYENRLVVDNDVLVLHVGNVFKRMKFDSFRQR